MNWMGKFLGTLFGFMAFGPVGAVVGLLVGGLFDRGLNRPRLGGGAAVRIQGTFFRTTFMVMGHVCKADGRVSPQEIRIAEQIMAQMALGPEQRRQAIEYFTQGKRGDFDLSRALDEFRAVCRWQPNLYRFFLEVQIQAAFADGRLDQTTRDVLLRIAARLGLSPQDYARLESLLRGEQHQRATAGGPRRGDLESAYQVLGVSKRASDGEIKKAYRRLMSQHHPDKLVAKGLPEEMMTIAKEKTQEIRAAYEAIREARGLR
jgi:DnaJ like chaperone protein